MDGRPLLAVDGVSLAHRAYPALPKSIQSNAILGFTNFLLRLWDAEQPAAVLAAWDSLDHPTYRHEALPAYQSGRVFEDSIVEQLDRLPDFIASFGFACAKAAGYEADDFLAAAARRWKGAKAPLPRLAAQKPNWARAAEAAKELGLGALAGRLESRAAQVGAR